jgi:hypothetical protein
VDAPSDELEVGRGGDDAEEESAGVRPLEFEFGSVVALPGSKIFAKYPDYNLHGAAGWTCTPLNDPCNALQDLSLVSTLVTSLVMLLCTSTHMITWHIT